MAKICMFILTLTNGDLFRDSRVMREAEALGEAHEVVILDTIYGEEKKEEVVKNFKVKRVRFCTKKLPRNLFFWIIKYMEFCLRMSIQGILEKADVYHAHDLNCLIPAYIAAKVRRAKVVYDSHELYNETNGKNPALVAIWTRIEQILINRVDKIIAANGSRAQIMHTEYGATELPVVIMNCPSNHSRKNPEITTPISKMAKENTRRVIYQGVLSDGRNLENVVEAVQYVKKPISLTFIGAGDYRDRLYEVIKENNVEHSVFLHDPVPYDQLLDLTELAHLGIVIYKNDCRNNYFCAPNKLFEYAMAGIPVVGSNFPEISQIVQKYKIGAIFDPENPKSIAEAIDFVFENEQRYEQMKRNTERVRSIYNWENEKIKLLHLYDTLCFERR